MSTPPILKILLVENDPQFVYLIQRYAQRSGCQLTQVGSIKEIEALAAKEIPDLILLDLALNGPDDSLEQSCKLLQSFKADPVTAKIRVFICSASEVAMRGWEEYADGCLLKPVMYEDFVTTLASVTPHAPSDATGQSTETHAAPSRQEVT